MDPDGGVLYDRADRGVAVREGIRKGWAALLLALAGAAALATAGPAGAGDGPPRPNIVFVLADDLSLAEMEHVPDLKRRIAGEGAEFTHAFVSLSVCCPSRVTMLRGQYAHNTTIFTNRPPKGGWQAFRRLGLERDTVATWLQAAGYRTGWFGKYMNGYPDRDAPTVVPPGWDDWVVPVRGNAYKSYDYALNDNGRVVEHGSAPRDHITDVLADEAVEFIKASSKEQRPFLAWVSTYAPHLPSDPPPRHAGAAASLTAPRPPSFDEADLSDKAAWATKINRLSPDALAQIDEKFRLRVEAMLGVQDLVEAIVTALRKHDQLDNTYLVFTSDNGFHMGQHRLRWGKNTHFDEDLRVPLYVRGPGVAPGRTIDAFAVNVDFAPTFTDIAGTEPGTPVDGRSLLPLLRGESPPWRKAVLIEHQGALDASGDVGGADPAMLEPIEDEQPGPPRGNGKGRGKVHDDAGMPAFAGVRTEQWTYVRYKDGTAELYDLRSDPHQLDNLAAKADAAVLSDLDAWTEALRTCRGETCRSLEAAPPAPK